MSIAYVGEIGKGTGTTNPYSITLSATPTPGNLLVARIGYRMAAASTITTVTDDKGNTWTGVKNDVSSGHAAILTTVMDVGDLVAGDHVTFTFNATPGNGSAAIIDEFSGMDTSGTRLDKSATGSATTTSRAAGTTATTAQADELIVAAYSANGQETAWAKDSNFTNFTTPSLNSGTTNFVEGQYRIVSATGAYSAPATGSSVTTNGVMATFKMGAAPPASPPQQKVVGQAVRRASSR